MTVISYLAAKFSLQMTSLSSVFIFIQTAIDIFRECMFTKEFSCDVQTKTRDGLHIEISFYLRYVNMNLNSILDLFSELYITDLDRLHDE